ncbi:hypothetical protein GCM10027039_41950 [Terrabacter koreensis]
MSWLSRLRGKSAETKSKLAEDEISAVDPKVQPGEQTPATVTATWPFDQGRPAWMRDGMTVKLYPGAIDLDVVGESHHQRELRALAGVPRGRVRVPQHAILVPESGNPHDENAIGVWISGLLIGRLSRRDASTLRAGIVCLAEQTGKVVALDAVIVGGGARDDGEEALLGVWLTHDPEDFGLPPEAPTAAISAGFRTGLSEAISGDEADDSYDLGWLDTLPDQPGERLPVLRKLMRTEREPLSRHYLMRALEADLYACRVEHVDALEEYDQLTVAHDSEMGTIRPALLARLQRLPLLETYRQATIRHSKAGHLDRALWWAKRGIEVYGPDAHNQAWVADLEKRVAVLEAKLERQAQPTRPSSTGTPPHQAQRAESTTETLVCRTCGSEFTRAGTRGRKPHQCLNCKLS